MAITKLNFSRNWENPEDFPTVETDEVKVRQDMQFLHDEIKKYINETLIPGIQKELTNLPAGAAGGYYIPTVKQVSEKQVEISFTASKEGMAPVNPVTITLPAGPAGSPGMSAYEAAQKGGYTGTEAEFYQALAGAGSGGTGGGTDPDDPDDPDDPETPPVTIRWFLEDQTDYNLSGEYWAEAGMTWAEFVNSAFNALGLLLTGDGYLTVGGDTALDGEGSTAVHGSDVIQAEGTYYLVH